MIEWGDFYRLGGALSFTPNQIKEMSIWEFVFAVDGWKKSNGVEESSEPKPPSEDEFFAAIAAMEE